MTKWWWKRSTNAGMTISIKAPYQKIISYILWSSILSYDDPIIMIWWSLLVMVFSWQQGNTQLLRYQSGTQVAAGYHQNITWSNQVHRIQGSTQSPRCHQGLPNAQVPIRQPGGTLEPTYPGGTLDNPPTQVLRWDLGTHLPRWHLGTHLPRWHLGQPTYPGG